MRKLKFINIFFVVVLFFIVANVHAEPVVNNSSGTFSHGQSVIIYGSGFGDKFPAAPARFEDFEETNSLRVGGSTWSSNWWGAGITYNRTNESIIGRRGNFCGKTNDLYSHNDGGVAGIQFDEDNDYVYAYRKEYYGFQPIIAYPGSINHKVFRVWNSSTNNSYCLNAGNRSYTVERMSDNPSNGQYNPTVPLNQWNTCEHALKNSSIGIRDGKIRAWYNNQKPSDILIPSQYIVPAENRSIDRIQTRNATYPGKLVRVFIEHELNNDPRPPAGSYVWVDDLYIDNSWARVMIGDQSTYDGSTNREIQIPSAWSGNSITITVNQGSFSAGETAYLFVVDADGSVSSGYPITIGSGEAGDINPPYISDHSPAKNASNVPVNSNIVVNVQDSGDGVDELSIALEINGETVAPSISGTQADYMVNYDPAIDFPYSATISVSIDAKDLAGNVMPTDSYFFTTISEPDTTLPTIQITSPTTDPGYNTTSSTISLAGSANDNVHVSQVIWSNTRDGSGTASGTTNWTTGAITLAEGENVITVTAEDSSGNTQNDSITVNYTIPQGTYTEIFGNVPGSDHPGILQDTFNNVNPSDQNYSTSTTGLNTYTYPAQTSANTIILKWDIGSIPINAIITDAKLYLYQFESGGDDNYEISVHKIINHNTEVSYCNWDTYDGANSWTGGSNGGLQDIAYSEDVNQVSLTNNEYKVWSVTGMVQGWVLSQATNFGMLLTSDQTGNKASVNSHRYFIPTENADENKRPKLVVTYTVGDDTTPPGDVTSFTATPDVGQVRLSWTNPTDNDFAGVMIRYRTDGTYPTSNTDGTAVPNGNGGKIAGSPGQNMSYVHTNLDPTTHYYYSAFTYDLSNNYSQTAHADAQPLPPNRSPEIVSFTATPSTLNNPGETTTFNVSATDPDGDPLTYTISFGDGTANGSGSQVVHTYEAKGTYTAEVSVNDGNGHSVGQSLQVPVNDIPPASPENVSAN